LFLTLRNSEVNEAILEGFHKKTDVLELVCKKLKDSIICRLQKTSKGPNSRITDERHSLPPLPCSCTVNPHSSFGFLESRLEDLAGLLPH